MLNEYSLDQIDAIKLEASDLTPKEKTEYERLEVAIGEEIIEIFGSSLSEEQQAFLKKPSLIVINPEIVEPIVDIFNHPTNRDIKRYQLNEMIYTGYGPNNNDNRGDYFGGISLPNGLTIYNRKLEEAGYHVGIDFVDLARSRSIIPQSLTPKEEESLDHGVFGRTIASSAFANTTAHEKNHAIQDPSIPQPLQEAQSYWLAYKVITAMGGTEFQGKPPIANGFIKAFDQLYKEFGEDINKLIWGNIKDKEKANSLLENVKKKLTVSFVNEMLPKNFHWKVIPIPGQTEPFYLTDRNILEDIETQIGCLKPKEKVQFRELEAVVSDAFIKTYGNFLSPKQIEYLKDNQIIFTTPNLAKSFETWDNGLTNFNPEISPLGNTFYRAYQVGIRNNQETSYAARQYWGGRIIICQISEEVPTDKINREWLMSDNLFDKWGKKQNFDTRFSALEPHFYTNLIGSNILHEKVHGLQNPYLPLPIQESAAYFYEREVFKIMKWRPEAFADNNIHFFADLYAECLREIGDDLNRYIFGTLSNHSRWLEIHSYMSNKFSPKNIAILSKKDEYPQFPNPDKYIHWQKKLSNTKN